MRLIPTLASIAQIPARDHDLLTGLADDDHGQYLNVARHDLVARHPLSVLDAAIAVASSGTYTGDGTANRAIPHGLGKTPKLVYVYDAASNMPKIIVGALALLLCIQGGSAAFVEYAVTIPNGTNFYVGNATDYSRSANFNDGIYKWVAIG